MIVNLYFYDIRVPLSPELKALVTPERRSRAMRYLKTEDRDRCLAAGVLLNRALGVTNDDQLVFGRFGKPAISGKAGLHFNLSHSGDYVVLATAECPLGVDVERIRPLLIDEIVQRCFVREERSWLDAQPSYEAFFRLWTGKEAVMKAVGMGIALDPSSFCILPPESGLHKTYLGDMYMRWEYFDGHVLCIAAPKPQERVDWHYVKK